MKKILAILTLVICSATLNAQVAITGFNPAIGVVTTTVTITGTGFDPVPGNNTVRFNGTIATVNVSAVAGISIAALVPSGATSGPITVTVGGVTATSISSFTVVPTISSFFPPGGPVGTSVSITGTGFDPISSNNKVKFNGTDAIVVSNTPTSITTSVPAGTGTGPITVKVGNQTATSISNFAMEDSTPPVVAANNTLGNVTPNSSVSFSANFTDAESGVINAKVQYRPVAGALPNTFMNADMILTAGSTYEVSIPASPGVTELGVEYKFLITNGAGVDNSANQKLYNTVINHSTGLQITSYPGSAAGIESVNYRMIAIPLILVNKTANDVFNNVLGGYDPTIWRMFRYNGSRYIELSGSSALVPGEGYWFIAASSSPLDTGPGTTVDVTTSTPYSITLNPGWNQIGNPYNFNISWSDVIAENPGQAADLGGNNSKIRIYRGTIENVDVLKSLEGGFVKFFGASPASIKIPVAKNASIQGRVAVENLEDNSLDQPLWEILFKVKHGNLEYNLGGIGMHPEAKEGFDYHDDFNAPRFIDYLEVNFSKKYFGMTYTKDVVPTAENHVWEFSVESNLNEKISSLNWNNTHFGGAKEIYLLDVRLHKVTDMNGENHYDFNHADSKEFKIVFGNSDFVKRELVPDRIVLYDPYPNPFVDEVTIGFALPKQAIDIGAEIEILNSNGSRVAQVQTFQPGVGSWLWKAGEQASGIYFVRLKSGNQSGTRKLFKR